MNLNFSYITVNAILSWVIQGFFYTLGFLAAQKVVAWARARIR